MQIRQFKKPFRIRSPNLNKKDSSVSTENSHKNYIDDTGEIDTHQIPTVNRGDFME